MKNKQMIQNKSPEIQLQCPVMVPVLAQLEPTRRLGITKKDNIVNSIKNLTLPITITHVATNHHQRAFVGITKRRKKAFQTQNKKKREREIILTNTHFNFFLSLPSSPLLSLSSSIPNLPKES
ncbi:hypothetical protein P8452_58151 [Trifolium repens]|nr:hypothetical protein P8452_58151 [Trifolium repens]